MPSPDTHLPPLSHDELLVRARNIKLMLTDCDGVLTDTGVYYSSSGEALRRFSIRDGMGVELLHDAGIQTAIVTGEKSKNILRRGEKLQVCRVDLGIRDKKAFLGTILAETGFTLREIACIGDDVNDLGLLETIGATGLTGAPADAMPVVRSAVHYLSASRGGYGAFRDFADWILDLRGSNGVL